MNKKIIYIMGAGRSGSTLLDIILGNLDQCFSAGELNRYPKREGNPPDVVQIEKKVFWDKVKSDFESQFQFDSYRDLSDLNSLYEYHSASIRNVFLNENSKQYASYMSYTLRFYEVLSNHVEEDYIIDSSKYPMRGYYLNKCFPGKVSFIYLKRKPSDVVKSFKKKEIEQPSKNWFQANAYLMIVNILSTVVCRLLMKSGCKCIEISYNDLTNDPVKTYESLGQALEIDTNKIITMYNDGIEYNVGYLFDGNRLRQETSVKLYSTSIAGEEGVVSRITNFIHKLW